MRDALERLLARDVRTLLGLPIDVTTEADTVRYLTGAINAQTPCFLSTPNLNFLIASLKDAAFRRSVLESDWVIADGMPLVWLGRWLGLPLPERVPGSGIFEHLYESGLPGRPLRVFFFGGEDGVAEKAAEVVNQGSRPMECVGWHSPGFGSVEAMSTDEVIAQINEAKPDFLLVALGASKGQAWIMHNRDRLTVPVISHLGAVVNFVAGTVARSPRWLQVIGAEWIWRMLQEPRLVSRYWSDGVALLRLVLANVIPLWRYHRRWRTQLSASEAPSVLVHGDANGVTLALGGNVHAAVLGSVRRGCVEAAAQAASQMMKVTLDLAQVRYMDAAAMGLLQIYAAALSRRGGSLVVINVVPDLARAFQYACMGEPFDVLSSQEA